MHAPAALRSCPRRTCRSQRSQAALAPSLKEPGAQGTQVANSSVGSGEDPSGQGALNLLGCGNTRSASAASEGRTSCSVRFEP